MNDRASPAALLEAAYAEIGRTRMAGLPILNPALQVEAVGFAPWSHHWLGVLVTPWFMNVVVLPREQDHWRSARDTETVRYTFPAGELEFIAHKLPTVGELHACSLFSPMFDFADADAARAVAAAAREALFTEPPGASAAPPQPAAAPMTKREFLSLGRHDPGR